MISGMRLGHFIRTEQAEDVLCHSLRSVRYLSVMVKLLILLRLLCRRAFCNY